MVGQIEVVEGGGVLTRSLECGSRRIDNTMGSRERKSTEQRNRKEKKRRREECIF
jgi:hypothetical protein